MQAICPMDWVYWDLSILNIAKEIFHRRFCFYPENLFTSIEYAGHEKQEVVPVNGNYIFNSIALTTMTLKKIYGNLPWNNTTFNALHAKFLRGKINIYLHFMSLLHIDMTQVPKILSQVRPGPTYSTESMSFLLMSWRRKEPGHQQPWYWPS